jgi:thioredoxin 1
MKVLKFEAAWCGPCKMLSKVLEGAEGKYTTEIEVVDIDVNPDLAKQYGVRGVPTMVKIDGDKEVDRKVGMMNETQLLEFLG